MASLAMNLRRVRKAKGMTQETLARRAHMSLGYLSRLEAGRHDPPLSRLRTLAKALGVRVTELLE